MRKKLFIHASSQTKYMAMSILPAFLMSIFCTFFIIKSGQAIIEREKYRIFIELSSFDQTIQKLESESSPLATKEDIRKLKQELRSVQDIIKVIHFRTLQDWEKTKVTILIVLSAVLVILAGFALLYSHRIAGPFHRLKKTLDLLASGKDVQLFQFRNYDEFKEVADSLDRLRRNLKDKGFIR